MSVGGDPVDQYCSPNTRCHKSSKDTFWFHQSIILGWGFFILYFIFHLYSRQAQYHHSMSFALTSWSHDWKWSCTVVMFRSILCSGVWNCHKKLHKHCIKCTLLDQMEYWSGYLLWLQICHRRQNSVFQQVVFFPPNL